jgi:hypothetical protein
MIFFDRQSIKSRKVVAGDQIRVQAKPRYSDAKLRPLAFILDRSLLLPRLKNHSSGCSNVDRWWRVHTNAHDSLFRMCMQTRLSLLDIDTGGAFWAGLSVEAA